MSLLTLSLHNRGHGVGEVEIDGEPYFVATVPGVVDRVNKLLTVRPFSSRYSPEVGDVVIGRVVEVADNRWKVDINARHHASLHLSSVNLPGGQRRRTDEDSLQMRSFFTTDELLSAEVQKVGNDRSASLHTRSAKYGKLSFGQIVKVSAALIKRTKQHTHTLSDIGVDMIIGVNGYIWIGATPTQAEAERRARIMEDETQSESKTADGLPWVPSTASDSTREAIARLRNCIEALGKARAFIYKDSILAVYNESISRGFTASQISIPENAFLLTQQSVLNSAKPGASSSSSSSSSSVFTSPS